MRIKQSTLISIALGLISGFLLLEQVGLEEFLTRIYGTLFVALAVFTLLDLTGLRK